MTYVDVGENAEIGDGCFPTDIRTKDIPFVFSSSSLRCRNYMEFAYKITRYCKDSCCIIKLATVIRCRKNGDEGTLCFKFITVFNDLLFCMRLDIVK